MKKSFSPPSPPLTRFLYPVIQDIVIFITLTVISAMMIGTLFISSFYLLYHVILSSGIRTEIAIGIIIGVMLMVTGIGILLTYHSLEKLKWKLHQKTDRENPLVTRVNTVAYAFLDGLFSSPGKR